MRLPNIAIDGPAASGKTTVARLLARRLKLVFLDTGAMYRAVAWSALEQGIDCNDGEALTALAERCDLEVSPDDSDLGYRIAVDGCDVTDQLHEPRVDKVVSLVAKVSGVRRDLVRRQQAMAAQGGVIMVGRDITTVVMPDADYKFFLDADVGERAHRRFLELQGQGSAIDEAEVLAQLKERDRIDTTRSDSPLQLVSGVTRFDSTGLNIEQVVNGLAAACGFPEKR